MAKRRRVWAQAAPAGRFWAQQVLVKVERSVMSGSPQKISTSFIERQNLTLRMSQRRLTRLSNGFSKKYENHCAAIALYAFHYNFCRVHETLRITPAMQLGLTDRIWSITEMVSAALTGEIQERVANELTRFRVIQGGKL